MRAVRNSYRSSSGQVASAMAAAAAAPIASTVEAMTLSKSPTPQHQHAKSRPKGGRSASDVTPNISLFGFNAHVRICAYDYAAQSAIASQKRCSGDYPRPCRRTKI
jgi:hypothetical protein